MPCIGAWAGKASSRFALHHAHELCDYDGRPLRMVHRDVSPHNVLLSYEGVVKVVDFGIAKVLDSQSQTRTGVVKGKLSYMAPEQARAGQIDVRADVFSVGVMLWEAIAGTRMWRGLSNSAIYANLLASDARITDPAKVRSGAPVELCAICSRALSWDPARRHASALVLKQELEAWLLRTGPPIETSDLGALITRHFVEERSQVHQAVESALRAARTTDQPTKNYAPVGVVAPAPRSRRPLWFVVAAGLLVTAGGCVFLQLREDAPAEVRDVRVLLATRPPHAALFLDGQRLPENPHGSRRPRDTNVHRVRAEAPGFLPAEVEVSFESDLDLDLRLEPAPLPRPTSRESREPGPELPVKVERPAAPSRARAAAAASPVHTASDVGEMRSPSAPRRKSLALDTELPWQ
jgi:serine/threonine-protein kinase